MDPAGPPGHLDRRTAALSGVCLERTVLLDNVRLEVRDWPGPGGPVVHVPDPACDSELEQRIATLSPGTRVFSITPRSDQPYQVLVADLHGLLAQFGFLNIVLVAEGLSCASAVLLAAWYPEHVRALVLVGERQPDGDTLLARSLRDCPPVRQHLTCPVIHMPTTESGLREQVQKLLG
jgi:pimeloyl-ACP methyl ester carboxylesterase